ncbi:MAG TPA: PAS domain S-box protein [Pirellulales bacterium]|jgi:PAS domain S-box-containing protein|nr:PAS domain S-box protein [Pirellulales bacterium]
MKLKYLLPITLAISAVMFLVDLLTPLEVLTGISYLILAVAFPFVARSARWSWAVAGWCTFLIALGVVLDPRFVIGTELGNLALTNHSLLAISMWCITGLVLFAVEVQKKLAQREMELRTIVESEPECVSVLDCENQVLQINQAGLAMLEADQLAQVKGHDWCRWIVADNQAEFRAWIRRVAGGESGQMTYEVVGLRGTRRWLESHAVPLKNPGQPVVSILAITRDITVPRMADETLRALERRFRAMVEKSFEGVALLDEAARYQFAGDSIQRILGWQPADFTQRSLFDDCHPDDRRACESWLREISTQPGESRTIIYRRRHQRGDYRWIEATLTNLLHDPAVQGIVNNFRDITERRRAEEESRRHLAEMAHTNRLTTVGQMVVELTHEINQPLYAISNFSQASLSVLKENGADNRERAVKWTGQIGEQARRAAEIIRRLRRFVQADAPIRAPSAINDIGLNVIRLLEMDPRLHGVRIRTEWLEHPPPIYVDRIQIEQVLVNLLINAAEAMEQTPLDEREIVVATRAPQDQIEVTVRDSGCGLPQQPAERVFESYYTTKPDGMGMGLAISRSLIEDHGGKLWVEANPDRGVTFHFTLPLTTANLKPADGVKSEGPKGDAPNGDHLKGDEAKVDPISSLTNQEAPHEHSYS